MTKKTWIILVSALIGSGVLFYSCAAAPALDSGSSSSSVSSEPPLGSQPGIYVGTNGSDTNTGTSKTAPVLTLQTAILKVLANGRAYVYVASGTYTYRNGLNPLTNSSGVTNSGLLISNSGINFYGGWDNSFSSRAADQYSVLHGSNVIDHVVLIKNSSNVLMDGFVVRNGLAISPSVSSPKGGGFYITNSSGCIITNCIIADNEGWIGGGINIESGGSNRIYGIISNNTGGYGGGVYISGSPDNIINASVVNNSVGNEGGGILINGSSSSNNLVTGQIFGNSGGGGTGGGGILINGSAANNKVVNALVSDNYSYAFGGGISFRAPDNLISNTIVSNNTARQYGGGIALQGTDCKVYNSRICLNKITNDSLLCSGGGIYISGAGALVYNSRIENNSTPVDDDRGGGISFYNVTSGYISNSIINSNSSSFGGGVCFFGSIALIANSSLFSNKASQYGGGVYSVSSTNILTENTISANNAVAGCGLMITYSSITLMSNTIASNAFNNYGSGFWIENAAAVVKQNRILNDGASIGLRNNTEPLSFVSNIIGGAAALSNTGISESTYSDSLGHTVLGNIFITNRLKFLYYDFNGSHIVTNNASWANINNTNYSGAAIAGGNSVQ
jgi:hypothetical protein